MPSHMNEHHFSHSGHEYSIHVALLVDTPATYAVEVCRDRSEGKPGRPMITMTVRADYDNAFVQNAMPLEQLFKRGEELIRSMYL